MPIPAARPGKPRVYVDGHVGTTGLRIRDWLSGRPDLQPLSLPEASRKDPAARRARVEEADAVVLCLPDDAAREAAAWAAAGTRVVDASTAHRVADGWTYGLPELDPGGRARIAGAARVSNPGCYPSAFVLLVRPLVDAGLLAPDAPLLDSRALRLFRGRTPPHRTVGGAAGRAREPSLRGPLCARPGAQAHPGDGPLRGPRPRAAVRAGGRPLPVRDAGAGSAAGRPAGGGNGRRRGGRPGARGPGRALRRRTLRPGRAPARTRARRTGLDPRACNDTNRMDLHVHPHPSGHVLLIAILDNLGKARPGPRSRTST